MDNPSFVKILVDCDESEIVKQFANGEYVVIPSRNILLITSEQFDKTCEALRPEIQAIRDGLNAPGSTGVRALPVVGLIGKKFFFDERLAQYRNVENPNEFYDMAEMDTLVEIKRELDVTTDDTPEVRELMRQWDELSRAS